PICTLFPYTTLFRSRIERQLGFETLVDGGHARGVWIRGFVDPGDRLQLRLQSRGTAHPEMGVRAHASGHEPQPESRDDQVKRKRSEEHTSELQSPYD